MNILNLAQAIKPARICLKKISGEYCFSLIFFVLLDSLQDVEDVNAHKICFLSFNWNQGFF
jgi:hypothetical protein